MSAERDDEARYALNLNREELTAMWVEGRTANVRRTPHKRRLYPVTEPIPMTVQTANGTAATVTVDVRMTTYKPNPFRGIDRVFFAIDEWQHRMFGHLPLRPEFVRVGWYVAWGPFCRWWDRRMERDARRMERDA